MGLKNRISMNLGWVLASWVILFVAYFLRMGLHPFVDSGVYVTLGSIATVILLLPEWLASRSSEDHKWFNTHEFFTLTTVVGVSGLGLLIGGMDSVVSVLEYVFLGAGAILIGWALFRVGLGLRLSLMLSSIAIGVLFTFDLYYTEGVTPHFYERLILGNAFIDTLSHAAISNILATQLVPSVGLDGLVPFQYHWGSHALLGGIINLATADAIAGYNLAYPSIFVVLLFKSMVDFIMRIGEYYGHRLQLLVVVVGIFMVMLVPLLVANPYLWMESTTVANVFMLFFLSVVLVYVRKHDALDLSFALFSVLLLVMISVLKISHGFVLVSALGLTTLRVFPSMKTILIVGAGGLVVLLVVLFYVYPVADTSSPEFPLSVNAMIYYIGQRFRVFWSNAGFPWSYVLGIVIVGVIWLRKGYFSSMDRFKKVVQDRESVEFETLLFINLAGLGGALYVSGHGLDVFFFLSVQLLLSTCYLVYRVAMLFTEVSAPRGLVLIAVVLVLAIGVSTKPNLLDLVLRKNDYSTAMSTISPSQQAVFDLMIDLKQVRRDFDPRETAIYIAQKEHWYHGSQENSRGAPFLVPAMSGIVSIGGISELVWYSSNTHYGFDDYRMLRSELIYETSEAVESARKMGFKRLISYSVENNELVREVIEL